MVRRPSRLAPLALPPVQVSARDELIALDVFTRAQDAGQRITLAMVEARLAELRSHRPGCRCRHHCRGTAKARADRIFETVRRWHWSTAAQRLRTAERS